MRKLICCFFTLVLCSTTFAQLAEFEGKLLYRTTVKSRAENIPSALMQRLLFAGDTLTIHVKNGQYLRQTGIVNEYYVPSDEKVYVRFKGIDTLYYRDYADDTTALLGITKKPAIKKLAGYDCPSITLTGYSDTSTVYYASSLYANPVHAKKLLLSHQNVLAEQTSAIWLESEIKGPNYTQTYTCFKVVPEKVDDRVLLLPELPVAKLSTAAIYKAPKYSGRGSWAAYLQQNMNLKLVANSIPLKRKEKVAEQTAQVSFVVAENGEITDVYIRNMKEVHPSLAEEAIRLVRKARWQPATLLGERIAIPLVQPIVFRVEAE